MTFRTGGNNTRMSISSSGKVVIGDGSDARCKLQVGTVNDFHGCSLNAAASGSNARWDPNALVVHPTATSNTVLNDPKPVLYLGRKGLVVNLEH